MPKGLYSVQDVAKCIIYYSNKMLYGVSNLKLQKLLYFVQAKFLVETGVPCFDDEIQAWEYGPVVPSVYREYKCYGGMPLPTSEDRAFLKQITDEDKQRIESIVTYFGLYTATDLVKLTHHQDPWEKASDLGLNSTITPKSIQDYFA